MKTHLVTVSSRIPTEPYYHYPVFINSLQRLGVKPTVLGMGDKWEGLMTKPNHFRKWLRDGNAKGEQVIICDCWDVIFTEHPEAIGERCQKLFGEAVVFNGERGCWPRADLAEHFPDTGTPWRYLNSGFMCGPADRILQILESMNLEEIGVDRPNPSGGRIEPNDQGEFQKAFVAQPVKMVVDGRCELAQTFSACDASEFEITSCGVRNRMTGTQPGVLHANGNSKETILPLVMKALGL